MVSTRGFIEAKTLTISPLPGHSARFMHPPFYMGIGIALMFLLTLFAPGSPLMGPPWNGLGLIVMILGVGLAGWSAKLFAKANTSTKSDQPVNALVTSGPYRFSRNPMYIGMVISLCGLAMVMSVMTPWIVPPLLIILLDRLFVQREEKQLREKFGRTYTDYCAQVRRWI